MDREDIIKLARQVGYPLVEYERTPYIPPLLAALLETVAAAQRTWVGLTKNEVEILAYKAEGNTWKAVELTETKLKEKNNG